ncbi:tRNA (adenosine(37)-N6)-threonylcarbamoyltransferase complex dimerization subunit type 1 TsaB [Parahaliea aestuarii]|uniref:tRNA threonylcarbamoyladenosine biosynthesis protein TsaB n=1 Tax=Parahaliea aestuarii TaxID=1852021 RepID=A0A5C8ZTV0_9GAMM|nr:tRNA (adenosine(37)-N6)-threonylcarbamoyltransferase complex dimerization subunit type 1 TsaB [Parahaliea aestuarii]TXS90887.1 tRNA (adenosine(37)-N6)-threonylcarbamoyltransferase complex dimerization subunit type 1 TsaB [Parahaliea aestuarii]
MANLLAIDTSTDACSVALLHQGEISECHEIIPRQHSQRLFGMLAELLPSGRLREQGIDAICYGEGPGSFTGLRVCASAVQGLCFANRLPAVPVSTLEAQAHAALREGLVSSGDTILSTLDAQIGELYWCRFRVDGAELVALDVAAVCKPGAMAAAGQGAMVAVGSGLNHLAALPSELRSRLSHCYADLLPRARDQFPVALAKLARGQVQSAEAVCPVYVRDEISWKKLSEQGKPA